MSGHRVKLFSKYTPLSQNGDFATFWGFGGITKLDNTDWIKNVQKLRCILYFVILCTYLEILCIYICRAEELCRMLLITIKILTFYQLFIKINCGFIYKTIFSAHN